MEISEESLSEIDQSFDHERIGPRNCLFDDDDTEFGKDFAIVEDIHRLRKLIKRRKTIILPIEKSLRSKPEVLLFKNFRAGITYHRRLSIINQSIQTICLRYQKIECDDEISNILETELQIETLDVARIKPGLKIWIHIEFSPRQSTYRGKENNGSLVFTTWTFEDVKKLSNVQSREFRVPVRCLPSEQAEIDIIKSVKSFYKKEV